MASKVLIVSVTTPFLSISESLKDLMRLDHAGVLGQHSFVRTLTSQEGERGLYQRRYQQAQSGWMPVLLIR